jgi:hypothetical protein
MNKRDLIIRHLLARCTSDPEALSAIAEELQITHAHVHHVARECEQRGMVSIQKKGTRVINPMGLMTIWAAKTKRFKDEIWRGAVIELPKEVKRLMPASGVPGGFLSWVHPPANFRTSHVYLDPAELDEFISRLRVSKLAGDSQNLIVYAKDRCFDKYVPSDGHRASIAQVYADVFQAPDNFTPDFLRDLQAGVEGGTSGLDDLLIEEAEL